MISRRHAFLAPLAFAATAAAAHDAVVPDGSPDQTDVLQSAVNAAMNRTGAVALGAGVFDTRMLKISGPVMISGVPGKTVLVTKDAILFNLIGDDITIEGIGFVTDNSDATLLAGESCSNISVSRCTFTGGARGIGLQACGGRVVANHCNGQTSTGIFSNDARGMIIAENVVEGIANNGIQVWRSEKGEDGTQIFNNRVAKIRSEAGGNGQNGNGINVYRAGNVIIANNRITDCVFSGIRNNSNSNVVITGNSISRAREVALYVEFAYQGAVVSNNVLEDVGDGISITNFNEDGRLAVCSGNMIRKVTGGPDFDITRGIGITAEADTVISDNVLEDVRGIGIQMGWGPYGRNLSARGNLLRDCGVGIAVSVVEGIGLMVVKDNIIEGSKSAAVQGFDHAKPVTDDWAKSKPPKHVVMSGNIIR